MVIGLYAVLWGKAKDLEQMRQQTDEPIVLKNDQPGIVQVVIEEPLEKENCKNDLQEPLLSTKPTS